MPTKPKVQTKNEQKPFTKRGKNREQIKEVLATEDPTKGYHSTNFQFYGEIFVQELPQWRIWTGRMMLTSDPIVNFSLNIRNAALMAGEVTIEAKNPQIKKWLEEQWSYLWNQHRSKLVSAKKWGFQPLQVKFKMKDNLLCIKGLKDFAPEDARALEVGGVVCGERMKGVKMFFPQALWLSYQAEHGNPYGYGCLRRSYPAWYEKWMNRGAKRLLQLRMIKDCYIGDIVWYPPNMLIEVPDGNGGVKTLSYKDVMREFTENRFSGAAGALPRLLDNNGKELTGYTPPQNIAGASQIYDWLDHLDDGIMQGADVPTEVVKASETGSGYSGRSIPMLVLLSNCTQEFSDIVSAVVEQVLRPMVWLNWGGDQEFEMRAKSLVESFSADTSGSAMGGSAIGTPQGGQQPMPQQIPPQQYGEEDNQFHSLLSKHHGNSVHVVHEIPHNEVSGSHGREVHRISKSGEGVFGNIGGHKSFVSGKRLRLHMKVPVKYITPDSRYENLKHFQEEHPDTKGGDVYVRGPIPKHWVHKTEVVDDSQHSEQDVISGGKGDKSKASDFPPDAVAEGIKVEMEHTSDPQIALEIALDHLTEDVNYYKKLQKVEQHSEKETVPCTPFRG